MNKSIIIRRFFLFFIFVAVLSSCHDNEIFYSINEQTIKTCNGDTAAIIMQQSVLKINKVLNQEIFSKLGILFNKGN